MAGTVAETERRGFTAVAREQLPWLYSLACRLVGRDRAEDTVQECLLKATAGSTGCVTSSRARHADRSLLGVLDDLDAQPR